METDDSTVPGVEDAPVDFFDQQIHAKRKTFRLTLLFLLAVALIVLAVHAAVAAVAWIIEGSQRSRAVYHTWVMDPRLFLGTVAVTLGLILLGSLTKMAAIWRGGRAVAEGLGGRQVQPNTRDPDERRVLNVVEEMAIASGLAAPPVFLLESERSINAFAAGFTPGDAVIGVSGGTARLLTRDEMQGVMAHEFSHVLNGDMRLNLRLIGLLQGILLIGLVGQGLLRALGRGRFRFRFSGGGRGKGAGGAMAVIVAVVLLGLALTVIGSIGVFFGRLIKAAVSRQREFLADASAVQFTRNPAGIAGALKKIGGMTRGARLHTLRAEEASHLFFGDAVGLHGLMATHPPLEERIRRIEPQWDGTFAAVKEPEAPEPQVRTATMETLIRGITPVKAAPVPVLPLAAAAAAVATLGRPTQAHIDYARALRDSLPEALQEAAHEPHTARALVFALLIDSDAAIRAGQLEALASETDPPTHEATLRLLPFTDKLPRAHYLPLVEMAMPALQHMSSGQFTRFRGNVERLIAADHRLSLFEFTVGNVFIRHLAARFQRPAKRPALWYSLLGPRGEVETLLSTLAYAGAKSDEAAAKAFGAAAAHLRLPRPLALRPRAECTLSDLARALEQIPRVGLIQKRALLEASVICVVADAEVTTDEAEMVRVVAAALELPLPPLLPGEHLAPATSPGSAQPPSVS